ncbi:MAG: M48 family metallopeptidase [Bradymonadaceae bacterium]
MRIRLLAIFFLLLVPLAPQFGCSTTKGAAGKANRAAADTLIPPAKEEKLGEKFSAQVESELTLLKDQQVQDYVSKLGQAAVKAAGNDAHSAIDFEFHVVDDPNTVNAFAGPGGQIYFYTGLLKKADNTAEVMGVMAHEVAHVTERHIAERLVVMYGVQALANAALGENPALVAKLGTTVAAKGFLLKYSRDHETEADRVGFHYIARTKYNPEGMSTFFQKLSGGKGARMPEILSSHPSPENRVQFLSDLRRTYQGSTGSHLGEKNHQQIVSRLK